MYFTLCDYVRLIGQRQNRSKLLTWPNIYVSIHIIHEIQLLYGEKNQYLLRPPPPPPLIPPPPLPRPLPLPMPPPPPPPPATFGALIFGVSSTNRASRFRLSGSKNARIVEPRIDKVAYDTGFLPFLFSLFIKERRCSWKRQKGCSMTDCCYNTQFLAKACVPFSDNIYNR